MYKNIYAEKFLIDELEESRKIKIKDRLNVTRLMDSEIFGEEHFFENK